MIFNNTSYNTAGLYVRCTNIKLGGVPWIPFYEDKAPAGAGTGWWAPQSYIWPGRGDLHAAVGEGQAVGITGQALLLTVIGASGRGEGIARVDVVGIDGLPPGPIPANKKGTSAAAQRRPLILIHIFRIIWISS